MENFIILNETHHTQSKLSTVRNRSIEDFNWIYLFTWNYTIHDIYTFFQIYISEYIYRPELNNMMLAWILVSTFQNKQINVYFFKYKGKSKSNKNYKNEEKKHTWDFHRWELIIPLFVFGIGIFEFQIMRKIIALNHFFFFLLDDNCTESYFSKICIFLWKEGRREGGRGINDHEEESNPRTSAYKQQTRGRDEMEVAVDCKNETHRLY